MLLRKPRSYSEVYNDLDNEIVNVFGVLRDEKSAARLRDLLTLTPFAREEFIDSHRESDDDVEQARRTIALSLMGFGSDALLRLATGFRAHSNRSGTTPAHDWRNYPQHVPAFVERLRGVVIENRSAIEIIEQHDTKDTLFYLDPPYVHSTRSRKLNANNTTKKAHGYKFEMTDDEHRELAAVARARTGMVVLSGYRCDLYDELYGDWQRIDRRTNAERAKPRVESLWRSPSAIEASQHRLVMNEVNRDPIVEEVSG